MRGSSQRNFFAGLCLLLTWQIGCAACYPIKGVPARYLPAEMKTGFRGAQRTIDLSLLRQPPPKAHFIDSGDVLGVYVEGFVGKSTDPPPVFFPQNNDAPASFGLPYPVREDGTISLPFVGSVNLRGMTLTQAEERVRQAYLTPKQLISPDFHRVQVNLQRPRQYRILVIRQDSQNAQGIAPLGQFNIGMVKRGSGKVVSLPAYSNDVLNALTATDGLPGLDAENAVYVIRRRGNPHPPTLNPSWPAELDPALPFRQGAASSEPVIRGQSFDPEPGYLHSQRPAYGGYPTRAPSSMHNPAINSSYDSRFAASAGQGTTAMGEPIAPPQIWEDRPVGVAPAVPQPSANARTAFPNSTANQAPPNYSILFAGGDPNSMSASPSGPTAGGPPPYGPPGSPSLTVDATGAARPMHAPWQPGQVAPTWNAPVDGGLTPYGPTTEGPPTYGPSQYGMPAEFPEFGPGHGHLPDQGLDGRHVIRIPIRLGPGETADIREEDVILYDGDIVFIEARESEVFYTAGLLGGGQYTLPRDYDLDILQALSLAQSRNIGGGVGRSVGGYSALNNDVSISPSTAIVLRKLPDGGEVPIKIDLYRARTDLSERVVIQPGDFILLQYTKIEAIAAFFERHLLETAIFGLATQQFTRSGGN